MINNIDNSNVQTAESQSSITPKTAIELLKKGNQRFVANQTTAKGYCPVPVCATCSEISLCIA